MRPPTHWAGALTTFLVAVLGVGTCTAPDAGEQAPDPDLPDRPVTDIDIHGILEKRVAMIPMRDGARLHTEIYVPRDVDEPLPFIIERTPYGLLRDSQGYSTRLYDHPDLIEDRNIMVFQDLRGRFDSEGEYLSLRPPKDPDDPDGIDETTDAWDTIEWLVNNVPESNGRAGILGISYGGFTSIRASHDPHPALKAASPQATCADMFIGDDWHHNGAFRLEYAFNWIARVEGAGRVVDQHDLYEWFLDLGALSNINARYFHGEAPTWNAFAEHPNMDEYWETEMCGVLPFVDEPLIPLLHVLGWYDSEDFYGPLEVYKKLELKDANNWNNLVVGPWTHGGWTFSTGETMLELDFGSETGRYYKKDIEAKWFAHWLKDGPALELPEVMAFRTGANEWETFESWPPPTEQRDIYLHAGRRVSFDPPSPAGASASGGSEPASAYDEYISDPWNPVPYRPRPIQWPGWPTVAGRGPAVGARKAGRALLGIGAAGGGPDDERRPGGAPVRLNLGHRFRLGGEADRRVPRRLRGQPEPQGLPVHGGGRGLPGALPELVPGSGADPGERGAGVHDRSEGPKSHVQGGTQDHGSGSEHLVPGHRSESAVVGAEHL